MAVIEIEIPDWADKHELLLYHGIELIGVKRQKHPWVIKEGRCSRCGTCCQEKHIKGLPMPIKDGVCMFLRWKDDKPDCSWGTARPFCCCMGEPRFEPNCTITWRYMEGVDAADQIPEPLETLAAATEEDAESGLAQMVPQSVEGGA